MNDKVVYLVQEREFIRLNEPTYKLGRTSCMKKRLAQYPKGTKVIHIQKVDNAVISERYFLERFDILFERRREYGREYFSGDPDAMKKLLIDEAEESNTVPLQISIVPQEIRITLRLIEESWGVSSFEWLLWDEAMVRSLIAESACRSLVEACSRESQPLKEKRLRLPANNITSYDLYAWAGRAVRKVVPDKIKTDYIQRRTERIKNLVYDPDMCVFCGSDTERHKNRKECKSCRKRYQIFRLAKDADVTQLSEHWNDVCQSE